MQIKKVKSDQRLSYVSIFALNLPALRPEAFHQFAQIRHQKHLSLIPKHKVLQT